MLGRKRSLIKINEEGVREKRRHNLRYEDGLDFYVLLELQGQIIYLNSSNITS